MDSSDEEGEIVAECVTNYHFTNNVEELVSFTILPLKWSKDENQGDFETPVFLLGSADDDGLQKIHKLVNAWRFELSYAQPEIYVLYKNKNWLALQKPRKSFEKTIRTILTTIHFLHFVKKNPEASGNSVWTYLFHALSSFEVQPSERDLLDHIPLISEAVKRDTDLAKSKYLLTYMENPFTNRAFNEDMQTMKKLKFIADMDDDYEDDSGGKSEDKNDGFTPYDHVCAICDNGGEILCCEGRCMRSFHANKEAGADSFCESLGLKDAQIKALPTFLCKNCKYQQHQCFACGKLGSSDKSSGAEVFACASATCVHFYHPECVANLLHPANENQAEKLQDKIAAGESFTCPAHKCFYCKEGENKRKHEMQFAICRRCPKAYHRKCLPRSITFECNYAQNIIPRAWDGLLPNRILIYCMDHKIIRELGTPVRNHLKFPGVELRKKIHSPELLSRREKGVASMKSKVYGTLTSKRTVVKSQGHIEKVWGSSVNIGGSTKKIQKRCGPDLDSFRKPNTIDAASNPPKDNVRSAPYCSLKTTGSKLFMGNYNSSGRLETCPHKFKQKKLASGIQKKTKEEPVVDMASSSRFSVDAKMESRIMALMEKATSSFNSEEFLKSKKHLAGNALLLENLSDRTITMGKVEGSVQAIRTALSILDEGGSIEDAKAVCEPDILSQIFKWKRKLNVYLSPFLHGMRYTSFGRHFTKLKKLEEIVKRLHWYMQDGDTLVDFCCGSNDFSCLMKEKLEKTGKHCKFKNYDLIVPKNDFNFEKRDWMTVNLEELPNGSQLIMGLNPPFGVKAYLANKFISKALEFKPKLLILIVPRETKLLDPNTYKLIWKDEVLLSGKSFYLPGSVDANDKQLDNWNKKPPPLYIWSRRDWSDRHMAIAQEYGHIINKQNQELQEGNYVRNCLRKKNHDSKWDDYSFYDSGDISGILDSIPEHMVEAEPQGAGAIVHEKVTESCFPMDWKNNLGGMEEQPSDIDGFGIDMELSTPSPTKSPPLYTADQHHTAPYMAYEAQHFASSSFLPGVYYYQKPMVSGSGNYTASGPQSQNLQNP